MSNNSFPAPTSANGRNGVLFRLAALLLALWGIALPTANGQNPSLKKVITTAEKAGEKGDYYKAFKLFQTAIAYDSSDMEVWYRYADAARNLTAYDSAAIAYREVMASQAYRDSLESESAEPLISLSALYLGETLLSRGLYEAAKDTFQLFLDTDPPVDALYRLQAQRGIEKCDAAIALPVPEDAGTLIRLGEEVNTGAMEFSPLKIGDTLFYSSYQFEYEDDKLWPKRRLFKLMKSVDGAPGVPFPDEFHPPGKSAGHAAFSADGLRIYYTICDYVDRVEVRCDLYYRDRTSTGAWGPAKAVPFNVPDASTTQPATAMFPFDSREVLFFASDREDLSAQGGYDLWMVRRETDSTFTEPVNLGGTINTFADDIAPFYSPEEKTLYFSSRGYTNGLGGFDIYRSEGRPGNWGRPELLPPPVNSSYDDSYFTVNIVGYEREAFLASKRENAGELSAVFEKDELGRDKERCCHDLYRLEKTELPPEVRIVVLCEVDASPIPSDSVTVSLFQNTGYGREPLAADRYSREETAVIVSLEQRQTYDVEINATGYGNKRYSINTNEPQYRQGVFYDTVYMAQTILFTIRDNETGEPLPQVQLSIFEDGGRSVFTGMTNADGKVETTGIDLRKSYRLEAQKEGYEPTTIDPLNFDPSLYCKPLSAPIGMDKEKVCLSFTQVFFDNDQPDPGTRLRETDASYDGLYDQYKIAKDAFIRNYRESFANLPPDKKEGRDTLVEIGDISIFFDNEVEPGWANLRTFAANMKTLLEDGETIELELIGFASPRFVNENLADSYNYRLSERRISSLRNYFRDYLGREAFQQYLDSGRLILTGIPNGDRKADPSKAALLKDYQDKSASLYSSAASLERRVEIRPILHSCQPGRGTSSVEPPGRTTELLLFETPTTTTSSKF